MRASSVGRGRKRARVVRAILAQDPVFYVGVVGVLKIQLDLGEIAWFFLSLPWCLVDRDIVGRYGHDKSYSPHRV